MTVGTVLRTRLTHPPDGPVDPFPRSCSRPGRTWSERDRWCEGHAPDPRRRPDPDQGATGRPGIRVPTESGQAQSRMNCAVEWSIVRPRAPRLRHRTAEDESGASGCPDTPVELRRTSGRHGRALERDSDVRTVVSQAMNRIVEVPGRARVCPSTRPDQVLRGGGRVTHRAASRPAVRHRIAPERARKM